MSKIFDELSKKSVYETEQDILKEWKKENILNKTIDNRKGCENFVFYDGPQMVILVFIIWFLNF